jgi:hypothetical protein
MEASGYSLLLDVIGLHVGVQERVKRVDARRELQKGAGRAKSAFLGTKSAIMSDVHILKSQQVTVRGRHRSRLEGGAGLGALEGDARRHGGRRCRQEGKQNASGIHARPPPTRSPMASHPCRVLRQFLPSYRAN